LARWSNDIAEDALHSWRQSETEEQMPASLQESVQAGSEEIKAEAWAGGG